MHHIGIAALGLIIAGLIVVGARPIGGEPGAALAIVAGALLFGLTGMAKAVTEPGRWLVMRLAMLVAFVLSAGFLGLLAWTLATSWVAGLVG